MSIQGFSSIYENSNNIKMHQKELKRPYTFVERRLHASMPRLNSDEVSFAGNKLSPVKKIGISVGRKINDFIYKNSEYIALISLIPAMICLIPSKIILNYYETKNKKWLSSQEDLIKEYKQEEKKRAELKEKINSINFKDTSVNEILMDILNRADTLEKVSMLQNYIEKYNENISQEDAYFIINAFDNNMDTETVFKEIKYFSDKYLNMKATQQEEKTDILSCNSEYERVDYIRKKYFSDKKSIEDITEQEKTSFANDILKLGDIKEQDHFISILFSILNYEDSYKNFLNIDNTYINHFLLEAYIQKLTEKRPISSVKNKEELQEKELQEEDFLENIENPVIREKVLEARHGLEEILKQKGEITEADIKTLFDKINPGVKVKFGQDDYLEQHFCGGQFIPSNNTIMLPSLKNGHITNKDDFIYGTAIHEFKHSLTYAFDNYYKDPTLFQQPTLFETETYVNFYSGKEGMNNFKHLMAKVAQTKSDNKLKEIKAKVKNEMRNKVLDYMQDDIQYIFENRNYRYIQLFKGYRIGLSLCAARTKDEMEAKAAELDYAGMKAHQILYECYSELAEELSNPSLEKRMELIDKFNQKKRNREEKIVEHCRNYDDYLYKLKNN